MAKKKNPYAEMYTLRPDGRYQGYYRDKGGKRHPVCDKDPEKLYQKIQEKIEAQADKPTTFREIAEAWHDAKWDKMDEGTKSCYKSSYDRAIAEYGDITAKDLMPRHIAAQLEDMNEQDFSKRSIKAQRTIYSLIYKFAINDERFEKDISVNPAKEAALPEKMAKAKKREAPEDDIVEKIQANAETAYFGLFAMFLICTGFRRGEALAVKWGDIDFDKKEISCTKQIDAHGKQGREKKPKTDAGIRTVPLLGPLEAVLHRPEGAKDSDYVFYAEDPQKPLSSHRYQKRWMHYCKDMGFVYVSFEEKRRSTQGKDYIYQEFKPTLTAHNMRHGYVTMLFEAGVDEYTAMTLAGHSDISVTRAIYTHLRNRKQAASTQKLIEKTKNGLVIADVIAESQKGA